MDIMTRTRSVADAKAHFTECLRQTEHGDHVIITRHGQPVAALVSLAELRRLEALSHMAPKGGLATLAGGWKRSDQLASAVERVRDKRTPPRRIA